jgi:dipeptidyl aminopeptidase/acylaminoacyl peptidase
MSAFALTLALMAQAATPAAPVPARAPSDPQARTAAATGRAATDAARPRIHGYGRLVVSPRGDRMAAIEALPGKPGVALVVRSAPDGRVLRTIEFAKAPPSGVTFSPAGTLAWLAAGSVDGTVTIVVDDGTRQRTVATVKGLVQSLRFSPDGTRLAALVVLNPTKETGATQAGARQIGEIGETSDEQRLAVFPLGAAAISAADVKPLSPADRYIYEYDWTPDGRGFAVTSALGNGDNNWGGATLDHVDAGTGAVRTIAKPTTQLNFPRVSPDGRQVAYIGGLMSDFGSIGGDVWTVPIAGGKPVDVTQGAPMTFQSLAWTRAGLRAVALHGDKAEIVAIAPDGGKGGKPLTTGFSQPVSLSAGDGRASFSADGATVATVAEDFTHAPAIYAGRGLNPVQVTHDNDAFPAAVNARSVTWKNEGYSVQGWLLSPLGADPAKKAPMIVSVHGGPSAASGPRFYQKGPATETIDAGYYLFMPNPRGSYGQGEAFTAANKRDFGGGDLRDILAGVDAVEKVAPVDDNRLGLIGCSYGGFMAMWANTQTNRFKAIVAGAGLSNWVSYYGTNGIDQWLLPFFDKTVYEDYKIYEDASAVYHVKSAKTPTFIYVGERDIEVPPTQSIEWWHALRDKGVDTSLVIYPDAGHCVPRPDQNADVRKRALAWFDKYVGR